MSPTTLEEITLSISIKNTKSGQEFLLNKETMTIGRDADCDIVLEEGYPSRFHAQIIFRNGKPLLDDLSSTNGTFINSQKIHKATPIQAGDILKFSTCSFTVLSNEDNDKTVISKKTAQKRTSPSYVVMEEHDPNTTQLQQEYPLPFGWPADDTMSKKLFQTELKVESSKSLEKAIQETISRTDIVYVAALVVEPDSEARSVHGLSLEHKEKVIQIGRSRECKVSIDEPSVSDHHAEISFQDGKWKLRDHKSTNGIRVNKKLVSELILEHDTTFSLGRVDILFKEIILDL